MLSIHNYYIWYFNYILENSACSGGSKSQVRFCCTEDSACNVGEGHCREDNGCNGNLVCGRKNCDKSRFSWKKTRCCEIST